MDGNSDMGFFDLIATVSGSSRPEPGHRHTRYAIDVVVPGANRSWTIQRRYHEFKRLHNALYAVAFPGPRLPPRQLWGPRTKAMLERRAESLDMWLQGTLAVWKSFYAPGDDEASLTVTSLLIVFLCRDQEFIVSHALGQYALSAQSALDLTGNTPPIVGQTSSEPLLRQMSSMAEQVSSSSSHGDAAATTAADAAGNRKKIHRFVHRMTRKIKSLFSVDVSDGIVVARGDSDASLRRSSGGTSPRHVTFPSLQGKQPVSPSTHGTIGLSSAGGWLQRGRMMFRRNSSKTKLGGDSTALRRKMPSRKPGLGRSRQEDDEEVLHRMFMEDSGPIISPTEEGSVHRVYADDPSHHHELEQQQQQSQETNSMDSSALNAFSTAATTSILATATGGLKKQSPQRITFNEITTEVEDSVHGGQGKISHGNLRKVISMTDDDGSELEWVFDSEDEEEEGDVDDRKATRKRGLSACDPLFLGDVIEYKVLEGQEGKKPLEQLFLIRLQVPTTGGIDVLQHGYGMVSVPPSPRAREVFKRPWKAYTDKLLFHVQRRLEQTAVAAANLPRSRASSGDGDWIDSGSEEGGSEAGGDNENRDGLFAQRTRWLQDTFREPREGNNPGGTDGGGSEYEDGYDSEGWASEAANESYDGGNDREIFGSWEEGTLWIGPKREPPPNLATESCDSALYSARNSYADDEEDDDEFDSNEYSDEDDEEATSDEKDDFSDSDYSHDSSYTDEKEEEEYSDELSANDEQEPSHYQREQFLSNDDADGDESTEEDEDSKLLKTEPTAGSIPDPASSINDNLLDGDDEHYDAVAEQMHTLMIDSNGHHADSSDVMMNEQEDAQGMEPVIAMEMEEEEKDVSKVMNQCDGIDAYKEQSIADAVMENHEITRMPLTINDDADICSTKDAGILEEKS